VYLRARYYDSLTGRFITKDPFPGFDGLSQTQNPYPYVVNNPILHTDPSGENPLCLALVAIDGLAPVGDTACLALLAYTAYTGLSLYQVLDFPSNTPPFRLNGPKFEPMPPFDLGPCPDPAYIPGPTLGNIGPHVFDYPLSEEAGIWWTEGGEIDQGLIITHLGVRSLKHDEKRHIKRINSIDPYKYINKHPWALTEPPGGPHVIETEQLIARLNNSLNVLDRTLRSRLDPRAETYVRNAIAEGQQKLQTLTDWFSQRQK
jgi:hypothetical protein